MPTLIHYREESMSANLVELNPTPVQANEMEHTLREFEYAIDDTLERAMLYDVCSQWSAEEAINLIARVKSYGKKIEDIRKRTNDPYRKMMTYNNEKCRPFLERLERVETILMSKIEVWKIKHAKEQEEMEKEAELLKDALQLEVIPFLKTEAQLRTSTALAYEKTSLKFEVECLAMIPINYIMVDEEKVEAALKAGIRDIPGIKIYEEKKTIVRSR
jgi:hypothetical protein